MWKLLWQQLLSCHVIEVFCKENCCLNLCSLMECSTNVHVRVVNYTQ